MSLNLHYAAAPRGRCQSLPKVSMTMWHKTQSIDMSQVFGMCQWHPLTCHRFMSQVFGMCHWKPEVSRSIVACANGVCASDVMSRNVKTASPLMSKLLAKKLSTPLSENIQIGPKVSIFCVATIIFQHCLNPLVHGVHQSFTSCHWSPLPLLHDDITELVDVRDLALLHLLFEDAPQMLNRV